MSVLIIEPDKILGRQYKKAFEKAGFKVTICSGAQVAVAAIDKEIPSAVVMEIQLAKHSGIEFLHEFRSYEDWADIPLFILSRVPEYALGGNEKIWQAFNVRRYFYKPSTSLNQLVGVVKEATKK